MSGTGVAARIALIVFSLKMHGVVRAAECLDEAMQLQRFAPKVRYAICGNAGTTARKRDHQD
jgi:hypothetical protein